MTTRRFPTWTVALALCSTCAVLGACGGDDDAAAPSEQAAGPNSEIEATFKGFEEDFQSGDAAGACARLSTSGQRDAANLTGGSDSTCVEALTEFGRGVDGLEQKPSRIVSVKVNGSNAVAKISDAGRPAIEVPFTREGGEWKLDQLAVGGAGG
jgi:hypothetical protein